MIQNFPSNVRSFGLLGLLVGKICFLNAPAIAGSFSVPRLDQAAEMFTLIVKARVTCRVYTEGSRRITEYCEDGYTCGSDNKCLPGPEMRQQLEAERAKRLAQQKKQLEEYEQQIKKMQALSQQAGRQARRATPVASNSAKPCGYYYTPSGGDPKNIPSPQYVPCNGTSSGGQSQGGVRPARNPNVPQRDLSLRDNLRYTLMINGLVKLRDSFQPNSNDWNNADTELKNLDKKLLDNGVDLKVAFTDVYNPLPIDNGSKGGSEKPSRSSGPPLTAAGKFCDRDPADARHNICWQKASNGYCKKWRVAEDGHTLPSDYDPHDTDSFSDNIVNANTYTQPCPDGATKEYDAALKKPAAKPVAPADESKPTFGDTFPQEECANRVSDYMRGDIDLASVPEKCQPKLKETLSRDAGPDAGEIESIKKNFEKSDLPPGAVGDAFGQPVGEVYGPPVPPPDAKQQ